MATGRVKWFNEQKGFGFIVPDEPVEGLPAGSDLFVHFRDVVRPYQNANQYLVADDRVRFEVAAGPRGPMAVKVKVIG